MLKLGKTAARNMMGFRFGDFVDHTKLPTAPLTFNRKGLVQTWYGLGNDRYLNCVWAGAAHETMLGTVQGMQPRARFTIHDVCSDYSAVTGFDRDRPATDVGTDMLAAANYRRKVGIIDATGNRHKVDSYLALRVGDVAQLIDAMWLTGAVGVGVRLPSTAEDQFDRGEPWTVVESASFVGGHYVPVYDRLPNGNLLCVTFGQDQEMTPGFYDRYNDESCAYVMMDRIVNNVSPEAFDLDQMLERLAVL